MSNTTNLSSNTNHKKFTIIFVALLSLFSAPSWGLSDEGPIGESIVGTWKFYKVFYDGTVRPPFSPNLQLYFQFSESGESRLYYYRKNEQGFCERKGRYFIDGTTLIDKVTWVNSKNGVGCGQDPDMRIGNETRTKIDFQGGDFHLYLSLKGQPLIYIWKAVDDIEFVR